jgi:uncharacterized membrane protein YuzA (DUF378 family)
MSYNKYVMNVSSRTFVVLCGVCGVWCFLKARNCKIKFHSYKKSRFSERVREV